MFVYYDYSTFGHYVASRRVLCEEDYKKGLQADTHSPK